ncbi:MAG: gluconolactonase [Fervidobacterium sp.]|uniref:NHL repeat-containing protein n=1 Tax=Fervidobacterium gondwanense DSM 13020 TaxID=1121883 RepID=A0A1M7RR04_FERGO|nr:gluconolactonase [Fervidobacterium gondwanense]SHN48536.1 NHL repeat-containing protein [Fervidobacterium gondwanense DSM 13020]
MKLSAMRFVLIFCFLFSLLFTLTLFANTPYYTYTLGVGNNIVRIQDAFEPFEKLIFDTSSVSDIFWKFGKLYLADTQNAVVVVFDMGSRTYSYIGEGQLLNPEGIYVDDNGNVYVADSWGQSVYKFSNDGELLLTITKPESPIYGKSNDFIPLKVAADKRGNIYVVCQGVTNGLAVFNSEGRFLSFFGANTPKVTLRMVLQRLVFTESQKAQLLRIRPPSPTSLAIDSVNSVWTVTQGLFEDAIKRFNVAGVNVYPSLAVSDVNFIDIALDSLGNVYALSTNGMIYTYDLLGNLIFAFGGQSFYENRLGLFRTPAAITVSEDGKIFVLDKEDGSVVVLRPTKFGSLVLKGVHYYNQGMYMESEQIWREIKQMNSAFALTYRVLGNVEFKKENYSTAFEYFRLAQDSKGYSDAFWYIRNQWIQRIVGPIFVLVVAIALFDLIRTVLIRQGIIQKGERRKKLKDNWILRQIKYTILFLKNPFDGVYELKKHNSISFVTGIILYLILYLENILIRLIGSPLFFGFGAKRIDFLNLFVDTYRLFFLFVLGNFLVSEISEGEGRFKDIFIGTIVSFLPYILFSVPIALITNILTLNESFIYTFSMQVIWGWSLILLFIVIAQIHNFSFGETVKNILLTIFAMILITILIAIVSILVREEISFFTSVFEELIFRAKVR